MKYSLLALKLSDLLTHVVQNQILRAAIILLERSIGGREHGHVAVREGGVGHLAGLQELVELQQKIRDTALKARVQAALYLFAVHVDQLTDARSVKVKRKKSARGIISRVRARPQSFPPPPTYPRAKSNNRRPRSKGERFTEGR